MADIASFYRRDRWGSAWGVVDRFHPTPHKGLDVAQRMGGASVPALRAGVVVAARASSSVGHYITVRISARDFDTYCHTNIGVRVGEAVDVGDPVGTQARTKSEGGSAWTGQHTHLCRSTTLTGWAYWRASNLDPTPIVLARLTGAAGGGASLINRRLKGDKMILFSTKTGYHILHSGGVYTFTSGGAAFPNAIADRIGNAIPTDDTFIAAMKAQYAAQNPAGVGGGNLTVDESIVAPIVAALENLGVRIDGLPAEIDRYADGRKQAT